ncbi:hypothetical protein A7U43_03050 [Mycobacterium adipatum]|uniref:Uncharacterized protein n=1 Tax=Mycobacterium adipatum TaxID=1682113 RepID=A0A172UGZ1_9MYCO|nr:hypothetical protein A7U43_03050 [Mycobacterium adipatum]
MRTSESTGIPASLMRRVARLPTCLRVLIDTTTFVRRPRTNLGALWRLCDGSCFRTYPELIGMGNITCDGKYMQHSANQVTIPALDRLTLVSVA